MSNKAKGSNPAVNVMEYRELARRRLPRLVFDYLDGGAEDEFSLDNNQAAFRRLQFQPRPLRDIAKRDIGIDLFGRRQRAPFVIAPTGFNNLFWGDGDLALARSAKAAGIPFALSTAATTTIERIAEEAGGELWFQLYVVNREIAKSLVARALAAGYKTLVLTVDVPINGKRERDMRNGFKLPFKLTPSVLLDVGCHPRWIAQVLRYGMPQLANLAQPGANDAKAQAALLSRQMDLTFTWEDVKWLRETWPHTLLVKGLVHPEDALKAAEIGVDGVILSNHGGRQLDGTIAPVDALPDVVSAAGGKLSILIDSGIRRGTDIVKALALGADAVLLGRATLYALAAAGESGVAHALSMLGDEVDRAMALLGCTSIAELEPRHVTRRLD